MERSNFLQNIHINLLESCDASFCSILFQSSFQLYGIMLYWLSVSFLLYSMITPNGRFMTQKKICLSMSDCKFF